MHRRHLHHYDTIPHNHFGKRLLRTRQHTDWADEPVLGDCFWDRQLQPDGDLVRGFRHDHRHGLLYGSFNRSRLRIGHDQGDVDTELIQVWNCSSRDHRRSGSAYCHQSYGGRNALFHYNFTNRNLRCDRDWHWGL